MDRRERGDGVVEWEGGEEVDWDKEKGKGLEIWGDWAA